MILRHAGSDLPRLLALAKAADIDRGFGHVKEANVARYRAECERIVRDIEAKFAEAAA